MQSVAEKDSGARIYSRSPQNPGAEAEIDRLGTTGSAGAQRLGSGHNNGTEKKGRHKSGKDAERKSKRIKSKEPGVPKQSGQKAGKDRSDTGDDLWNGGARSHAEAGNKHQRKLTQGSRVEYQSSLCSDSSEDVVGRSR